jgi:exodeoxyribonuclease-3
MAKGFMDFFQREDVDIFCVQETKMQPEQAEYAFPGFSQHWNSAVKKGYSGTAVFTKMEPIGVSRGIGIPEHDAEGRVITLEYEPFFLVNCYTPNSQRGLARLPYRMIWEDAFRAFLQQMDAKKPVILCGDLNVAHKEIDIKNAKSNVKNAGFTPEERDKMTLLLDSGFADTFRLLYPDKTGAYTWWSYMGNARVNNVGWRIDYFLVSDRLKDSVEEAEIFDQVFGSDHCPVVLKLKM